MIQKIKDLVKNLLPQSFLDNRHRKFIIKNHYSFSDYDRNIFLKHSNALEHNTQLKNVGIIIQLYHIIEKGLTMPNMKLGFGQPKLLSLIDECLRYKEKYDVSNIQYLHAVGVIAEYKKVHGEHQFSLPELLLNKINNLLENEKYVKITEQLIYTKEQYFKHKSSAFDQFSNSRHSVRSFSGTVHMSQIEEAIRLAQNTPTACNRQPIRIHIVENKELIKELFKIQNGNRGFGHLVDKLVVITADVSCYQQSEERNLPYVDAGMYTMNLLYALHFNNVAAIPLNWCRQKEDDIKMRKLIAIPDSEIIVVFIGCGNIPENFKLALSQRNNYKDIYKTHN